MTRLLKAVGVVSFATLCMTLGACTANSDCCKEEQGTQVNASVMSEKKEGCCTANKEAQVNASVMSEKKEGCCSTKSAAECKDAAPKN